VALDSLEDVFTSHSNGEVQISPRSRIPYELPGGGSYNVMSATWGVRGIAGHKTFAIGSGGSNVHAMLYGHDGEGLLAIIEARLLGQIRTGAVSGIATKYLAKKSSSTVGIIGSGKQAQTQLEAVSKVRSVRSVRVFSRTPAHRKSFAAMMSPRLGLEVIPVDTAQFAVDGADVVITITNSVAPVVTGDLVEPGVHVNAAGGNSGMSRELDADVIAKSDLVCVDDLFQAREYSGELIGAAEEGRFSWDQVVSLSDVVAGRATGRTDDRQVTLFKSTGVAFADLAVCNQVYMLAKERGFGTHIR
jgi:ornithine cyclodeaminase/alanine dehydrogenase-like protein (mu-crystallin family)